MALIPKPPFPNVPKLPGVPQLPRNPLQAPNALVPLIALGAAAGALWKSIFANSGWGIYKSLNPNSSVAARPANKDGQLDEVVIAAKRKPVVVPDSFLELTYRNEYDVSDFPVQDGAFASYNKVANPFETTVRLSKGGSVNARKKFLESIEAIIGTLDLYDVVTPERSYLNVNLIRFELSRRGAGGAYFFSEVDLSFREIRQVSSVYTTTAVVTQDAQSASAVSVTNTGSVQPTDVTNKDVTTAATGAVGGATP
jgi:hypothetical protein